MRGRAIKLGVLALAGGSLVGCASHAPQQPSVRSGSLAGVYASDRVAMYSGFERDRNDADLSPSGPVVPLASRQWLFPLPPPERPVDFRRFEQD
ncbi:MAG: hypothetical protein AAGD00_01325 [Planctomycetota bacterium]